MRHIISVLVENHFGVLANVASLFSGRGYNIDSLAVGETQDATISRMTIVTHGEDQVIEQIIKQLDKLIDVIKVVDLREDEMIDRELVLCKVCATTDSRSDIMQIVNTFRAKIVDVSPHSLTIEVTGGEGKVDAMLELLKPFVILETARTGVIALSRKSELHADVAKKVTAGSKAAEKPRKKTAKSKKKS